MFMFWVMQSDASLISINKVFTYLCGDACGSLNCWKQCVLKNGLIPIINSCLQCDLLNYIQNFKQHLSKYILITGYLYDLILLCWHSTLNICSFGNSFVSLQDHWKELMKAKKIMLLIRLCLHNSLIYELCIHLQTRDNGLEIMDPYLCFQSLLKEVE